MEAYKFAYSSWHTACAARHGAIGLVEETWAALFRIKIEMC